MEGHCSTGQTPQCAVKPMEGGEEEEATNRKVAVSIPAGAFGIFH
jgi:hypothetical protein